MSSITVKEKQKLRRLRTTSVNNNNLRMRGVTHGPRLCLEHIWKLFKDPKTTQTEDEAVGMSTKG